MLKLIFSDLDNTLLNNNKTISGDTLNFLNDLKDIRFIVNSGRLPYSMESIKEYIDLSNIVCGNDSYIALDGKLIYSCCLDKKDAYHLLDYGYSKGYSPRPYLESGLYITEESKMPTTVKVKMLTKNKLYDLLKVENIYKIAFYDDNADNLEDINRFTNTIKNIVCDYSDSDFLECHHKDSSKGNAIDIVSKLLNVKADEILAIGDNENDLSMFNRGYHSACPSNACDKVKRVVEYVSPLDCNHDAMVDIIKHFL